MLDYVKVDGPDAFVDLSTLTRDQAAAIQEVTVEDYKDGGENARDVRRVKVKLSDKRAAGPGIWTRRIADYANHIGLAATVVCFDISTTQLEIARKETERYLAGSKGPKPTLEFQERDLSKPLPWAAGSFQLVLCNYAVLNHLCGARSHRRTLPRFDRSRDRNLRTLGSAASACIIGMEHVRQYRHDPARGHLALTLDDGSQHRLPRKMYSAQALEAMFLPHADLVDLRAIDLFVNRFAADENWTSSLSDQARFGIRPAWHSNDAPPISC